MSETITDQEIGTETSQHTKPSPEELAVQARLSPPCIGAHKRGRSCVEARAITDGYAYKPMGADESTSWEWMRKGDFESQFRVYRDATDEISELISKNMIMSSMIRAAMKAMNGKSLKRLTRKLGEYSVLAMSHFTER